MAEEEKAAEAAPAAEGAEAEAKPSFIQKFKPILMILGGLVVGAGGASGLFLALGPSEPPPAPAPVQAGAPQPVAHEPAANEHTGAALKDKELEAKAENIAELGEIEDEDVVGEGDKPTPDLNPAQIIKFDGLVVNIFEKNSIHYLKISMDLALSTMEAVEEYNVIKPKLRDRALFIISDTTLREILNPGGKALLKEDLVTAFNRVFKKGKVTQIFFTDFTVQ